MDKIELRTPISVEAIRRLFAGDIVYITGNMITGRDAAHSRIIQYLSGNRKLPFNLRGLPLYHCGPLVRKIGNKWIVAAAGPTTSMRMEAYEDEIIRKLDVRMIVGKGGMGEKTKKAMKEYGAVYGVFTGGAAVFAAKQIKKVKRVEWLDLGVPDAVWVFKVKNFGPLIIGIDAKGNSLFNKVHAEVEKNKTDIMAGFWP